MTSRTLKLLTASTAFIAAASAGNAAVVTYTSNSTVPVTTSSTTGINFSDTATVSVTTIGAAVEISGTVGSPAAQVIQTSSSAVLRSSATSGTIVLMDDTDVTGITLNNSGTIVSLGSANAIDATAAQADASSVPVILRNSGTISGSVALGANQITYQGLTNGVLNGDITTTNTGTAGLGDSVSLVGSRISGSVSLGNGTNTVTVSNSTVSGDYTGGTGADVVEIKDGSTFTGGLAMGAGGTDTLTVSNSTVVGNISNGAGSDLAISLVNATISGTMIDSSGNGNDSITVEGQNTFTTRGAITGFEALVFNTDSNINHTITGAATVNNAAGETMNVNAGFTASGALTNNGIMNIAAGETVAANSLTSGANSSVGLHVSDSTTMGKMTLTTGLAADRSLTIIFDSTAGYITSGTLLVAADGGTHTDAGHITNSSTGVYRLSSAINGSDEVEITVGRVETDSVVTGSDNKAVAARLDTISTSAVGALNTVHGLIGQQATAAGVNNIVESLTPSIDGAGLTAMNVTVDTGNQISNRLASIRSTSGVATGDAMANQHMWVQGFGSTVEQDDNKGNSGYDASAGGVSIGVDTDTLVNGMTTGLALSYARGKVDGNGAGNSTTDIDTYVGTLYGSRVLDGGVFVNGQLGLGYSNYDMSRNVIGIGTAKGDTNGWQGTAKVEAGKDFAANGFTLTPLASLQYTYLDMDSYTETGAGGASLRVNPESLSTVDAGAGGQIAYAIPLSDGGTLKPSVHAKYIYRMGDRNMGTTSSFTGGGASFNTDGVEADRSSVNLGAGLLLTTIGGTDLSLNYEADIRSSLTGHTGQLKARWAF